jgi:glycosyltransferase involved in cell wall biosynthesis
VDVLAGKATVLPVALEEQCFAEASAPDAGPLRVVWNHRWEYDKGPERLLAIVKRLLDRDIAFQLSVLGERFRQVPDAFTELKERLNEEGSRLRHWGYIESTDDYRACLATGDVVLSTALHDFQGLSMLEAVAAGCTPLAPERLGYPEWFDAKFLYGSSIEDIDGESNRAADAIEKLAQEKAAGDLPATPSVKKLGWPVLRPRYAELFIEAAAR